jgi:hypothetical protein
MPIGLLGVRLLCTWQPDVRSFLSCFDRLLMFYFDVSINITLPYLQSSLKPIWISYIIVHKLPTAQLLAVDV